MGYLVWTARLGMLCYALRLLWEANRKPDPGRLAQSRALWTVGFLLMAFHFAFAFALEHHWSHDHAVAATAKRTAEVVGWYWGGGVWFNYAFLLVWGLDVLRLWHIIRLPERWNRRWGIAVQAYLAFMAFNATAVFGPKWWIPVVAVYLLVLLVVWWGTSGRQSESVKGLKSE